MSLQRPYQGLHPDDAFSVAEVQDEDSYDHLTTVDQYVDNSSAAAARSSVVRKTSEIEAGGAGSSFSVPLSRCAVCQDVASGVHYGVPACEGCKGFFRRIVSSRNIGGACAHSVPLEMTPQSRNTCQWCRLKKCCAVNMGRQRSKLGRRAKLKTAGASAAASASAASLARSASSEDQILLPGSLTAPDSPTDSASCADTAAAAASSSTSPIRPCDITDEHLLVYVEQKHREFESQISRRSCFRKEPPVLQPQQQPPPTLPPSLLEGRLSGRRVASQLMGQPSYPSPMEPQQQQQQQQQRQAPVRCLRLISRREPWSSRNSSSSSLDSVVANSDANYRHGNNQILLPGSATSQREIMGAVGPASPAESSTAAMLSAAAAAAASASGSTSRAPKKVWLEKSCLLSTPLSVLCRRLAGDQRAAELEDLHNSLSFNNAVSRLILTAVDKFVGYWESDLNNHFSGNAACRDVIAENTRLIIEGHRQTFYFTEDQMRQFMSERLPHLYEPTELDESAVVSTLVGYIPQLMLRIVAFTRNIFGSTSSASVPAPPPAPPDQQQQHFQTYRDRVSVSSCSDAVTDADKKRLIMQHSFKLIGMRFCASLVQSQHDFIIDPTMKYRLTKRFLQSARHPMLGQLFLKFFDVSRKWDSLRIDENEMAFLSAFCLTSPYIGIQYPEDTFEDLSSVISVHSAVIGLFWIYLRSEEISMRGWTVELVASDPWLNLTVRLAAIKRLLELSTVFPSLLSVDGMHKQNAAMIESIIEKLNTSPPCPAPSAAAVVSAANSAAAATTASAAAASAFPAPSSSTMRPVPPGYGEGFPNFNAPFNTVGQRPPNPSALQQFGAGVYKEVFRG